MNDLAKQIAFQLVVFMAAMVGFWLIQGRELATRAEVSDMIQKESPYLQDRALVLSNMADNKAVSIEFRRAVEANTKAITELQAVLEHITRGMKKE